MSGIVPTFKNIQEPKPKVEKQAITGSRYADEISGYDWNATTAYKIMMCESSGRNIPSGYNKYGRESSHGLFQINVKAHTHLNIDDLYNPSYNIQQAYKIYLQQGWNAWRNCYKKITNGVSFASRTTPVQNSTSLNNILSSGGHIKPDDPRLPT